MKSKFVATVILIFINSIGFSQKIVDFKSLEEREGKYYELNSKYPYTGQCVTTFTNGKLGMGGSFKDGLRDGEWIWFYENGTKRRYCNYKKGLKNGISMYFFPSGKKKSEIIFDNDKNIKQTTWDENGKKTKNPSFESYSN